MKKEISREIKTPPQNADTSKTIQTKLIVGSPNDQYEQEAEAVADKIMRMPDQHFVQQKCAHCEEEEKQLQRKPFLQAKSDTGVTVTDSVNNMINSSKGNGSSMDNATASFMSNRFSNDCSTVKIHTDAEAVQMSKELNAKAFTVGNDIYFNEGQYQPASNEGKHLLAHELTHTIQQSNTNNKIQKAAWVCDEWQQSASGSYSPGPGISFNWTGNSISISVNLELYGPAATAQLAANMKSTIENAWTGTFGIYTVSTSVNATVRAAGASGASGRTHINCLNGDGVSNVMPSYWIAGSRMMNYYTNSDINWTPAHEFGHLLGLGDRYSENWFAQIFGSERTSTPDSGWSGNIMAEHGGVVQQRNIGELMGRFAYECTRSHLESPL